MPSLAWVLPPVLLGVYPALSLLAANLREASPQDALRSAEVGAVVGLLAYLGALLFFRQPWKACWVGFVGVLVFFSYGHVYHALKWVVIAGQTIGRHRLLLPLLAAAGLFFLVRVRASRATGRGVFEILAAVSLVAAVPPAARILAHSMRTSSLAQALVVSPVSELALQVPSGAPEARPDIYFILLDAHAREDVVHEYFADPDYAFPASLETLGFVVADRARSNYLRTILSLSATLNMEYLEELPVDLHDPDYQVGLTDALAHSRVRGMLERIGYTTYALTSSYGATEIVDADHYLAPDTSGLAAAEARWALTDFEELLLQQSILVAWLDLQFERGTSAAAFLQRGLDQAKDARREVILSGLANLEAGPTFPGPKFFFVHLVSPHYPYLFDANGQSVNYPAPSTFADKQVLPGEVTWTRYRDQMTFLDREMVRIVRELVRNSPVEPVIVIQSDHGPATNFDRAAPTPLALFNRSAILSAIYLPERCRQDYYPTISSVNTFRIVFNCLFAAGMPMASDRSYLDLEAGQGLTLIDFEDVFP